MKRHGVALVVIIIGWEIVEDVLFPLFFVLLGNHIHPAFYAGAPASLLLCVHWIAVPLIWGWWMKMSGDKSQPISHCDSHDHSRDEHEKG
jgi:hypothetical protein